jgi:ubiquinone/menaquinone biosynthesis C-methylase UbiE
VKVSLRLVGMVCSDAEGDDRMSVLGETAREAGRITDLRIGRYEDRETAPYWRMMREITWQHVRRFLPHSKNARVLDAGAALGYWSVRLAHAGYSVVLLDSSEECLAAAKSRIHAAGVAANVELVRGDVTDLREFSEGAFDMTLALEEPLSLASDPEMAVAEMALVTKAGGMVAASVANRFRSRDIEKFLKKGDVDSLARFLSTGEHAASDARACRKAFGVEEIEALFGANGLEVSSVIGKGIFASAAGGRLDDPRVFSRVLSMEIANNANRSLWGNADVLEFVATKP